MSAPKITLGDASMVPLFKDALRAIWSRLGFQPGDNREAAVYGIPRGGYHAAQALVAFTAQLPAWTGRLRVTTNVHEASVLLDDIVDSGATREKWRKLFPGIPFFSLVDRSDWNLPCDPSAWIVFPWEFEESTKDDSIAGTLRNRGCVALANGSVVDAERRISEDELGRLRSEVSRRFQHVLDGLLIDTANDPNSRGTADRWAKMMVCEALRGRYTSPPKLTTFPNTQKLDELYTTGPITVRSLCSHHFCPILGEAFVGVVPGDKLLGLSKFNRVVDYFARRGQIQEDMTVQLADFLERELAPKGLAVVIRARHTCMTWRGVEEHESAAMGTSVVRGVLRSDAAARAEFFALAGITKG